MATSLLDTRTDSAAAGSAAAFGYAHGIADTVVRRAVNKVALAERCLR